MNHYLDSLYKQAEVYNDVPVRRLRMYPQRIARRALTLGLLLTLIVLALSACGGGGSAQHRAKAQKEQAKARPLPQDLGALRPGEYHSVKFKPALSFHVGKGWSAFEEHASVDFAISMQGETRWVGLTNVQEVYKPIAKGTSTVESKVVEAPEDLVGWFQEHPYLKTSEPESVSVGGIKGEQFDMVVEVPEGYYGACGLDCMDIFRLGGEEPLGEQDGNKIRIIVLEDVNGDTLCFGNGVREASEFDEFMTEAQKVVDSVKWRDK